MFIKKPLKKKNSKPPYHFDEASFHYKLYYLDNGKIKVVASIGNRKIIQYGKTVDEVMDGVRERIKAPLD